MALGAIAGGELRPVPARQYGAARPKKPATVTGDVAQIDVISRKGMDSFYELTVKTPEGEQDRVLIPRAVAPEPSVHALKGYAITAQVNWSSQAIKFESAADPGTIAPNVRTFAEHRNTSFNRMGTIALAAEIFPALAGLILNMRRSV